jgi:membrane protease YdiL (CAAX protease family)
MESEKTHLKYPTTMDSGIMYTLAAILYVYASGRLGKLGVTLDIHIIIAEILFIALPPLVWARLRRIDIGPAFRFKPPRAVEVLIMLLISPIMIIAGLCAGFIALIIIKNSFGSVLLISDTTDLLSGGLGWLLLLLGVIPAFCEEILFRGFIQRGAERIGAGWSIFLSGILFGLFHFDFQRFAAQTLIGFIAAYAVYRTGSIFNGMILHFMNNGLLALFMNSMARNLPDPGSANTGAVDPFTSAEFTQMAAGYGMTLRQFLDAAAAVFSVILLASLVCIFGLLLVLRSVTKDNVERPAREKGGAKGLLFGIPGLALILTVYTAIGFTLLQNPTGGRILRFLGL